MPGSLESLSDVRRVEYLKLQSNQLSGGQRCQNCTKITFANTRLNRIFGILSKKKHSRIHSSTVFVCCVLCVVRWPLYNFPGQLPLAVICSISRIRTKVTGGIADLSDNKPGFTLPFYMNIQLPRELARIDLHDCSLIGIHALTH